MPHRNDFDFLIGEWDELDDGVHETERIVTRKALKAACKGFKPER